MLKNGVYTLLKTSKIADLEFERKTDFTVSNNVVWLNGHPLQLSYQSVILKWIETNPTLFNLNTGNYGY